jgi:alpha-D-ribose 1-methylphosphonate 5-triphosphate diphosphatase
MLLIDEPTASLDADSVAIVLNLLEELRGAGTTLIMICHDMEVVEKMADINIKMQSEQTVVGNKLEFLNKQGIDDKVIFSGNLVLTDGIAKKTDLVIQNGCITHIGTCPESLQHLPGIDASNLWVLPGFVDLHSDAIEKAIQPRPRAKVPLEIALTELDKNLAASGITTMHHCISFTGNEDNELRFYKNSAQLVRDVKELAPQMLVRTRIHARYEILETEAIEQILGLMDENLLDLVSLMDHTPGQGQFRNTDYLYEYYTKSAHLTRQQVDEMIERRIKFRRKFDDSHVRELMQQCLGQSIPTASHDDDTEAKVEWVHGMGVRISEFPVTLEAASAAKSLGMDILMGAPNIIFGRSLSDNLSGRDAMTAGCCNLIGSDYSPSSLLHSVFTLHKLGLGTLPELISMVSHQPARAIRQEHLIGSINEGLAADLILVDAQGSVPRVIQTFVSGKQVYACRESTILKSLQ